MADAVMTGRGLRREAHDAARWRGHQMARFRPMGKRWDTGEWNWWRSRCKACGAEVDVMCNPLPNQTDIVGDAVAINCEKAETWLVATSFAIGPFQDGGVAAEFRSRYGIAAYSQTRAPLGWQPVYTPKEWEESWMW